MVDVRDPISDAYDLTFPGTWIVLSCMVTYPISDLEGKVQSIALFLEMVDDAQGVLVVAESDSGETASLLERAWADTYPGTALMRHWP